MWGFGGRYYWGSSKVVEAGRGMEGIVVVFAWMLSEDKHLKHYVDLYASLGWDSLVCHPRFFNSLAPHPVDEIRRQPSPFLFRHQAQAFIYKFFPDKAELLALDILNELVEEIRVWPRPVVFASFSGGPKACLYKVLQIMEGKCEPTSNVDCYLIVKDSIAGHIYDSSPVDFISEIGTRFVLHPSVLKMSRPPKLLTWIASGVSSGLDALFINRFESQRAEYWQTLYSSVTMKAPYLLLCSEDDDLAPFETISNFAQRIKGLGADVTLVKWASSPHVGHYRKYPEEYKAAVAQLLQKASSVYSQRVKQLVGKKTDLERPPCTSNSEPFKSLKQMSIDLTDEARRASPERAEHFIVPSSSRCHEGKGIGSASIHDESTERLICLPSNPPSMNAHGILGEILFDVCVPKDVEDWELRPSTSLQTRKHSNFNPMKLITRSRL